MRAEPAVPRTIGAIVPRRRKVVLLGFGHAHRSANPPPGPRGYPLVGAFPMARKNPLRFFLEVARRYGDVVAMHLGVHRVYLVSHPDQVKHVLQDHHHAYCKSPAAARVRPLFGDSLTTIDGARWRRQRDLMRAAFHYQRILAFVPVITDATAATLDRWQRTVERGQPLDLLSEMTDLTRAIMLRVLFGDIPAPEARAVGQTLATVLEHTDRRLWSALGWLGRVPTPANRRCRHALRTLDGFVDGMVARAHRHGAAARTLLSMLLEACDGPSGEPMSHAELCDELKALLVAGHTTTASALAWVWFVLSEHANAQRQLHQELGTVLGGRQPGAEDLPALRYTRMLIEEVLRLYPPTWVTARVPLEDDEIGGYHIRANALVLLSPFVTHRHPGVWEDPDRFEPERFAPERSAARPRFAYFPFGGGPRSCIGSGFALAEMQLVVAMVAQRYRLTLVPGSRVDLDPGITLRPRHGLPMIVHQGTREAST